mgnify:FL=1
MWDKIWDDETVRKAKREARQRAYIGNKTVAGKAYDRLVREMEAGDMQKTQLDTYNALSSMYQDGRLNEDQEFKFLELKKLLNK